MSVENIITEYLDIWTSAIKTKAASGRGSSNKLELYGIKKLRELILDLAVKGKLVPQDLSEESAATLLNSIKEEKAALVREKKIRKNKSLPEVAHDECPFDVPKNWEFERLGNVVDIVRGITFPASAKQDEPNDNNVACLRTANVQAEIDWDDLIYVDRSYVKREDQYLAPSDIVMSMANSRELVGKVAFAHTIPINSSFGGFLSVIRPRKLLPDYIMLLLRTRFVRETLIGSASQTTNIANISLEKLNPLVIPVPPRKEQARIAEKVRELMTLCDQLESQTEASVEAHQALVKSLLETLSNAKDADEVNESWRRISEQFNVLFTTEDSIDQLKQTILQLAVMGKLVKQDPNDEPASKLIERIAAEKEQLINNKKITKQKQLPPISDEEITFELPENWEWVRIGDVLKGDSQNGLSKKANSDKRGVKLLKISAATTQECFTVNEDEYKLTSDLTESQKVQYSLKTNDLLAVRFNGNRSYVGRVAMFTGLDSSIYVYPDKLIRLRFFERLSSPRLICFFINSPEIKAGIERYSATTVGNWGISAANLKKVVIPYPPVAEQKRISERILELFGICDELKKCIEAANTTKQQLATTF